MVTMSKHRVVMVKVVSLLMYEIRVQRSLFISPKPYAYMGCVLVLPLSNRTPTMMQGLMTPDSIPSLYSLCRLIPNLLMWDVNSSYRIGFMMCR